MQTIPVASLPLKKQMLLAKSPLNPPIYITIEGHHFNKAENAVFYDVQVGIQKKHEVIYYMLKIRYSEFEKLHQILMINFSDIDAIKHFPPKKWFNNMNEEFLKEREKGLQTFLSNSLQIPSITETDAFKSLFRLGNKNRI